MYLFVGFFNSFVKRSFRDMVIRAPIHEVRRQRYCFFKKRPTILTKNLHFPLFLHLIYNKIAITRVKRPPHIPLIESS